MGGMAAQIPIKTDPDANEAALAKVRADKLREVTAGHDGTWVAHPGLVPVAMEVFNDHMAASHQIAVPREPVRVTAEDLLRVPEGSITAAGLRLNVDVGVRYLESWLRGVGCVPLYHLMEDAATAEISRTQVWQWVRHGASLDNGEMVTVEKVREVLEDVMRTATGGQFELASQLFEQMMIGTEFPEFLTTVAYDYVED
jgi:malate synthase